MKNVENLPRNEENFHDNQNTDLIKIGCPLKIFTFTHGYNCCVVASKVTIPRVSLHRPTWFKNSKRAATSK